MYLLVGLGNPGKEYIHTRHNIGWLVLEALATNADWQHKKKFMADMTRTELGQQSVLLAKPMTFMNKSGTAVSKIAHYYTIPTKDVWVIHDDVDLPYGTLRISRDRSSAGHRGVESIVRQFGSSQFLRFRIGIRPEHEIETERYVLEKFSSVEMDQLPYIIRTTTAAIAESLSSSPEKAASLFN